MLATIDPGLHGIAAERFVLLGRELHRLKRAGMTDQPDRLFALAERESKWARAEQGLNGSRLRYEAAARVLIDLAALRWEVAEHGYGVELRPPEPKRHLTPEEIRATKLAARQEVRPMVAAQFQEPSVREFLRTMEEPAARSGRRSILELVADGAELGRRLEPALASSDPKVREALLARAVRPKLQLVTEGERDAHTGHLLGDIWRYLRFSWSIPAVPTPGRQLLYLVRDAAHPTEPIMGIAALNNCALTNPARDRWLGWDAKTNHEHWLEIAALPNPVPLLVEEWERATAVLKAAVGEIELTGLCTAREAQRPTPAVIRKLQRAAGHFLSLRREVLEAIGDDRPEVELHLEAEELPPVTAEVLRLEGKTHEKLDTSRRLLVAKKRAAELARLLQALMAFAEWRDALIDPSRVASALNEEPVRLALGVVLATLKNERSGTCMLEITTCGAIPPYQHLLGGKLVALLLLSPQVSADYRRVYGERPSIISSQMKNEPRIKTPDLVFLGTTSLYDAGSSQYERLVLPAGVIAPEQPELRYCHAGVSAAYGTLQYTTSTRLALDRFLAEEVGYKEVNSIFGEGPSPKFRKVRAAITALGFPGDALMHHHQRRRVYAVELCAGAKSFLLGRPTPLPNYLVRPEQFPNATEAIASFWRKRWLARRLDYRPAIDALRQCPPWRLAIPEESTTQSAPFVAETPTVTSPASNVPRATLGFWRRIAAKSDAIYSDNLSDGDFKRLHVEQRPLEQRLLTLANENWDIVLTGNAGDGKTHLLRWLQSQLRGRRPEPDFVFDASQIIAEEDAGPLLDRWRTARAEGRQFFIAINEYPLHLLRRRLETDGKSLPALAEVELQCRHRLLYGEDACPEDNPSLTGDRTLVVDLSLRNPLHPELATLVLDRLLRDGAISDVAQREPNSDLSRNRRALQTESVRQRLFDLLNQLVTGGQRTTLRDLWITFARLLFTIPGEPLMEQGSFRQHYSMRLFGPAPSDQARSTRLNRLFDALSDPADQSHPHWDDKLETASGTQGRDWLLGGEPGPEYNRNTMCQRTPQGRALFEGLKRRFYFEHNAGKSIFSLRGSSLTRFGELLSSARAQPRPVLRQIIELLNRAYCPQLRSERERLHLWIGHRYHEQPSRAWLADRAVPVDRLEIAVPRIPNRLLNVLPYEPDHLLLRLRDNRAGGNRTALRIDFELFEALEAIRSGLPRLLLPERALNRLDDFLHGLLIATTPEEREFLIHHPSRYETLRVRQSLDGTRFDEIECLR